MIAHQNKCVDLGFVSMMQKKKIIRHNLPNLRQWNVKPLLVVTSCGDMIWKIGSVNWFESRHALQKSKASASQNARQRTPYQLSSPKPGSLSRECTEILRKEAGTYIRESKASRTATPILIRRINVTNKAVRGPHTSHSAMVNHF